MEKEGIWRRREYGEGGNTGKKGIWGRRKGAQRASNPPIPPEGLVSLLALAYLPPCRLHSTDILSGSGFELSLVFLGLKWQGSTAELPSLTHTFCSLLLPSDNPGRMWPAVTRRRVEQRVGFNTMHLCQIGLEYRMISGHLLWS